MDALQIKVKNFRGVDDAAIKLAPVALVCGENHAGKTSIAQAVRALLTGEVVPIAGVKKSEAGMLVKSGAGGAEISASSDAGLLSINYPNGKLRSEGSPPTSSPIAAGMLSVVDMDVRQASSTLIEYLKATPSREDVVKAAAAIGLDEKGAEKLWQNIVDLGWDGAHDRAKETGVKFKGQWEHQTGTRYGPAKAESWLPLNWASDLDGAGEEDLSAQLTQAREFLEAAIADAAVSQADVDRLQAAADGLPGAEEELSIATANMRAATVAVGKIAAEQATLAKPSAEEKTTPCPHCQCAVVIRGNALVIPAPVDADENERRRAAIADATARRQAADAAESAAGSALRTAERAVADAKKAAADLAALPAASGSDADTNTAREAVRDAEARLMAWRTKTQADKLHASVVINQKVVAELSPEGLRLRKLRSAIAEFNVTLTELCQSAGWGVVEIDDSLQASYSRRPWPLLSESERYRVRITLQVAMARMDGSSALVIDAADILDKRGRNSLMRLVKFSGLPALITMTWLGAPEEVPDLSKNGSGISYWLSDGTAQQLAS